ncbi:MAG: FkbM family methyltransferase [Aulosira sp. DedQUE10]|nr:FkbM family methyltransferase [Aulosira sp. DedQUE10]
MALLTEFTRKLNSLARYIENPQLFILRQRGVILDTFAIFNKPWIHELNIATVIDIGANIGQFAISINAVLPKAQIYSFEPIPDCFNQLKASMVGIKNFTAFNLGIGDQTGDLVFQYNTYSESSSFLQMAHLHKTAFPETSDSHPINVKIEKLDVVAQQILLTEPLLIKIDVQGYEDKVLAGGESTIKRAKLIIIETSFTSLYKDQPLFEDIYSQLKKFGFVYAGTFDQLYNPLNGKILQADSIFIKNN